MRRLWQHNGSTAWLAWHIAALQRAKKMPKLEKLYLKQKKKADPQTWQEQLAVMTAWAGRVNRAIAIRNQMDKPDG